MMPVRHADRHDLKFRSLADELRRDILAAVWAPGAKLPTDQEMRRHTGLALSTVRRAYQLLEGEGLVERRQGAGTFVTTKPPRPPAGRITIGVLVPVTQLYYGKVLNGIETELTAARAGLRFATYHYDAATEDARIADLIEAGVDGLVLVPTLLPGAAGTRRLAELRALPVPVVLLERSLSRDDPGQASEYVCSDHAGGANDAVGHLVALGHTRIALLARRDAATCAGVQRGYRHALKRFGLHGLELVHNNDDWPGQLHLVLAELRSAGCTAALVFGDREATLLLETVRQAGLRVPEDLALVSYDDEFADIAPVPLTAVSPPKRRLGQTAAQVVLRRVHEGANGPVEQIMLRPSLAVRASCGARSSRVPEEG